MFYNGLIYYFYRPFWTIQQNYTQTLTFLSDQTPKFYQYTPSLPYYQNKDFKDKPQKIKEDNSIKIENNSNQQNPISSPQNHLYSLKSQQLKTTVSHNILSNKINLILSYIRRINKSGRLVQKIINKTNHQNKYYSCRKYYAYQLYLRQNLRGFTHKDTIFALVNHCDPASPIFRVDEQLYFNQVCRVLIAHYLREIATFQVLHKSKLKNSRVFDHLVIHRYLRQILQGKRGEIKLKRYKI